MTKDDCIQINLTKRQARKVMRAIDRPGEMDGDLIAIYNTIRKLLEG